jgi:hypothetical protein
VISDDTCYEHGVHRPCVYCERDNLKVLVSMLTSERDVWKRKAYQPTDRERVLETLLRQWADHASTKEEVELYLRTCKTLKEGA